MDQKNEIIFQSFFENEKSCEVYIESINIAETVRNFIPCPKIVLITWFMYNVHSCSIVLINMKCAVIIKIQNSSFFFSQMKGMLLFKRNL